ncbi:protein of unknown function [Magnetospirillum sp. XM-1]|uniref:hypothetical protein n=1 Tax=Magnetospirillum sp. XM-1 TaxID=1663591 RepID=UPI00073E0B95|nr:hypothetical protein [Magnetospirillum sp. XM-1]CUW40444.1 protein of unknown function [Magnetospirillum sp. XM-1]
MSENDPGARCRSTAGIVVRAFAGLLEEQAVGGQVSVDAIRRTCNAVGGAGDLLDDLYAGAERTCQDLFALRQVDSQRVNYIGRIVTKTFAHVLDDRASGITRSHLGRLFAALRMILGEEAFDEIQERCAVIAGEVSSGNGGVTRWEAFYRHSEALLIRERILVSIARTFRRFEARMDWLLIVMNSSPGSRSLGGGAFVAAKPGKRCSDDFDAAKFLKIFEALFASCDLQAMDEGARNDFLSRWQVTPDSVFGPLLAELAQLRMRLSV